MASPWSLLKNAPIGDQEDFDSPKVNDADIGAAAAATPGPADAQTPVLPAAPDGHELGHDDPSVPTVGYVQGPNGQQIPIKGGPKPLSRVSALEKGSGLSEQSTKSEIQKDFERDKDSLMNRNMTQNSTEDSTKNVENNSKNTGNSSTVTQTRNVFDKAQLENNIAAIMGSAPVQGQLEDVKNVQSLLDQIRARKEQLNLNPLFNIANYISKGQSGKYEYPEAVTDKDKFLLASAQKLIQDKRDIANEALKNQSALKIGTDTDVRSQFLKEAMAKNLTKEQTIKGLQLYEDVKKAEQERGNSDENSNKDVQGAKDPTAGARMQSPAMITKWVQTEADKHLIPIMKEQRAMAQGIRMLSDATPVSDFAAMDSFIKGLVGGRVTNFEMSRQQGGRDAEDKIEQAVETVMTGKLTPANRGMYLKAMQTLEQAHGTEAGLIKNQLKEFGTQAGKPEDETERLLQGFMRGTTQPNTAEGKEALRQVNARPQYGKPATPAGMVRVVSPTGQHGAVPEAELADHLAHGFKKE